MGSFVRAVRYLRDFWKVIIRGENDDLARQTIAIQEELHRMRNQRHTSDKVQEEAALNQARGAVEKLRELHDSLLLAEKAAAEFACKIGDLAKSNLEAEEEIQRKIRMKILMQQKSLFLNGPVSDALCQSDDQVKAEQVRSSDKDDQISLSGNETKTRNLDVEQKIVNVHSIDKDVHIYPSESECATRHTVEEQDVVKGISINKDVDASLCEDKQMRNTEEEHDIVDAHSSDRLHISPQANESANLDEEQDIAKVLSTNKDVDISVCESKCAMRQTGQEHDIVEVLSSNKDNHVAESGDEELGTTRDRGTVHEDEKVLPGNKNDQVCHSGNAVLEACESENRNKEREVLKVLLTNNDDHVSPSRNESATSIKGEEFKVGKVLHPDDDNLVSLNGNPETLGNSKEEHEVLSHKDVHIFSSGNEEVSSAALSNQHEEHIISIDSTNTSQVLAQVMNEARKQVKVDEKAHMEALERNKAILDKVIEARAQAEGKNVS